MQKVINLYGGPGTGKSTTAAGVFYKLKTAGVNCEYIQEYAKDKTWEKNNTPLACQEYIFGKQQYRMFRVSGQVEFIITDSPLLLSTIYTPQNYHLPSLPIIVREAYNSYENLDIFLVRQKAYQPAGRNQTFDQAKDIDRQILEMLNRQNINFHQVAADETAVEQIINLIHNWTTHV